MVIPPHLLSNSVRVDLNIDVSLRPVDKKYFKLSKPPKGMGLKGFLWYSKPVKRLKSYVTYVLPADDIWSKDWDVLIILDACRLDLFDETIGECDSIVSYGSTSSTWIRRAFNRDVANVGYVTGNGHLGQMPKEQFAYFHIEDIQNTEYNVVTVPPGPIVDQTIHAWRNREQYDMDRLIVHFMQPHAPFRSKPDWFTEDEREDGISAFIWKRLKQGQFTKEEVWDAYQDNLMWVWEDGVSVLMENLDAKIVVSADHGNAFGEWGFYGHPMGCPVDVVREVPWYSIIGKDRETRDVNVSKINDSINREEHLSALGYR
jgi:hypothetical protein